MYTLVDQPNQQIGQVLLTKIDGNKWRPHLANEVAQLLYLRSAKMFDKDDVLVVLAGIIILHSLQVCKFPNQSFWVYPSLTAKKKYSPFRWFRCVSVRRLYNTYCRTFDFTHIEYFRVRRSAQCQCAGAVMRSSDFVAHWYTCSVCRRCCSI